MAVVISVANVLQDFVTKSQSPTMPPVCLKDEKPLLVNAQVKLVDPSDKYVAY
jgi:hypothetical protein